MSYNSDTPKPYLNVRKCDDADCPGWAVFNDGEIQRCDTCGRFKSDDEAKAYVRSLELLDASRHLEAASQRALVTVREELADLIESTQDYPISPEMTEVVGRLETLLGRSFWLERHRWLEHGLQFARLLSEIHAAGEESVDTETMKEPGYLSIKISELEESMGIPWSGIQVLFKRAEAVFQSSKLTPEATR